MAKDLSWWKKQSNSDKEYYLAYDAYLLENEVKRFELIEDAIKKAAEKKGFGVIAVMLHAIFRIFALKNYYGG